MCNYLVGLDTLVNVYVTLRVFTRIAGTSQSGCGRYLHFCRVILYKKACHMPQGLQPSIIFKYSVCACRFK